MAYTYNVAPHGWYVASYLLRLFELDEEGNSATLAGAYTINESLGSVRPESAQLQGKQKGKVNMKTLLLTLVLLIAGCGTNITQKAESSEPAKLISHVKVEFARNSKTPYKIQKYGVASNYGPSGPQITGDDKLAAQKTVGDFLESLSTNVETMLSEKLHQRNVQVGDEYMLRIFMDEIVVSIQGEKGGCPNFCVNGVKGHC